jgi:hypothetical protein
MDGSANPRGSGEKDDAWGKVTYFAQPKSRWNSGSLINEQSRFFTS